MKVKDNILLTFFLNLLFVIIEIIGGLLTGSISILSDSIHDLGDAVSLFIVYLLEKISKKRPNKEYTYGYRRYSLIGSLITAGILITGSFIVIYSAINRIMNPVKINYNGMLIFAVIGLIINYIGFKLSHKDRSMNEKMISIHLLEDTLSWLLVIIVSIVMKFTDASILDAILSILMSVFILFNVLKILKDVFNIILEKAPENVDIDKIKKLIVKEHNILDIHRVHIWSLDGERNYMTMHVVLEDDTPTKKIIKIKNDIKKELHKYHIKDVTIEFEYDKEDCYND